MLTESTSRRIGGKPRPIDSALVLMARNWISLPDTELEVYLFGKGGMETSIKKSNNLRFRVFGGWEIPLGSCYVRDARPNRQQITDLISEVFGDARKERYP